MKLASLKAGGRDGTLIVVDRDLTSYVPVPDIAGTLQAAIEDWDACAPALAQVAGALDSQARDDTQAFDPTACASPLPRSYQFADGSAYLNHVELVRRARGAEMPPSFWTDPLMYQGLSDGFLGPMDPIPLADADWGLDFEAEIAVILDDVPLGIAVADAGRHIKLVMLVNDISLRNLIPGELAKGFGFFHGKPASAFSPVAVTPDELGAAWDGGRVNLPLLSYLNDTLIGAPNAGVDLAFDFPALIAHAAKSQSLSAGTIIGSGTVSNTERSTGSSCLAEVRTIETLEQGEPKTPFMGVGDRVRILMNDGAGHSIFGTIDQTVVQRDITRS